MLLAMRYFISHPSKPRADPTHETLHHLSLELGTGYTSLGFSKANGILFAILIRRTGPLGLLFTLFRYAYFDIGPGWNEDGYEALFIGCFHY